MKKLLFAFMFTTVAAGAALAQDTASVATPTPPPSTEIQNTDDQDKNKQVIAASELPAPIQTALAGQDYSGWTVSEASKTEKDGQTFYAVELKNGAETKKVKFDAEGNVAKEKEKQ